MPSILTKNRSLDLLAVFLALAGLYWFTASFFLAKRSLSARSTCEEAVSLLGSLGLTEHEIRQTAIADPGSKNGCWMDRTSDSIVILLIDALRFDFAYYNLPNSVGRRLKEDKKSHLFQFVADPPTVTMQRLKALTTGGLPTFADISANFGGAVVEEDTWVDQLITVDPHMRGVETSRTAFVGDDTWEDLFPGKFNERHPYPSFNTRDLDTVDNGCLKHIPDMLRRVRTTTRQPKELELVVVHFLGVDHVGHTYGPHNKYMDAKLKQMDTALSDALDHLDASEACHTTFIFGDHGMTEDGNHGGSTPDETHAALFVHSSTACQNRPTDGDSASSALQLLLEGPSSTSDLVQEAAFTTISQIDLVSTLSIALGLPIPYANLGSFVPSLLPNVGIRYATAALALNAAQVWRYLTVYSSTANKLPNLETLQGQLDTATEAYKKAMVETDKNVDTDDEYQRAASLYKIFLRQALDLGQRVWTRFDMVGMIGGISVLALSLVVYTVQSARLSAAAKDSQKSKKSRLRPSQYWEVGAAVLFMVYECGLLTFSNSYILEEERSIMFSLSVLSAIVAFRLWSEHNAPTTFLWLGVLAIPISARLSEALVTGHGLDPSIHLHGAHSSVVFLTSLAVLASLRWYLFRRQFTESFYHALADVLALLCLAGSWWEKRAVDSERNGYTWCQIALVLLTGTLSLSTFQSLTREEKDRRRMSQQQQFQSDMITSLSKLLLAIVAVTGPSTATSLVFYAVQVMALYAMSSSGGVVQIQSVILASLLKLVTRQIFFVTNHGCAFNRLQYSAAFVATKEFYFVTGGVSLFLNTFGWEVAGLALAWLMSYHNGRKATWRIYTIYQLMEAVFSCISVSVLRRHLMVWDIYAPRFVFSTVFSILNLFAQFTANILIDN